jgi:hypothetical protein
VTLASNLANQIERAIWPEQRASTLVPIWLFQVRQAGTVWCAPNASTKV